MFTFHHTQTFEWPVKIPVPISGAHDEFQITGIFEMCDDADFVAFDGELTKPSDVIDAEITRLSRVFKGWKAGDIKDDQGRDFEPTPENVAKFLARRPNRMAVEDAYSEALNPVSGYRAKN